MSQAELQGSPVGERPRLGRYHLLFKFASGGMADVYLGRLVGADGFGRQVALKVIHRHLSDHASFVKMFIDEARLASRITHPNVALTLELGRVGTTHFIAMEYVDGETLVALLRRNRPPLAYCARIIADAAAGLHAAHELRGSEGEPLGVVHRDVSPQNILISYEGNVKVVDFGVARARGSLHTTAGQVKGKFSYMAPEQLLEPDTVDRRTDIFALGVVLYEATTWTRLFGGETEAAQINKVLKGVIRPPSELVKGYPAELEDIVMRSLARRPEQRFATAAELQMQLERYILSTGQPVTSAALGTMMTKVFADRIAAKKLRLERADSNANSYADASDFEAARTTFNLPLEMASPVVTPRRRWMVAALGFSLALLLLGAGSFTWHYLSASDSAARDKLAVRARTRPAAGSVAARPDAAASLPSFARQISISVQATPAHARVMLGGRRVDNPCRLEQPASDGELELIITAPGYETQRYAVPLSSGGAWQVALRRSSASLSAKKLIHKGGAKAKKKRTDKTNLDDSDVLSNPYR